MLHQHELVAIAKTVKKNTRMRFTQIHKENNDQQGWFGRFRRYEPYNDEDLDRPPVERQILKYRAKPNLLRFGKEIREVISVQLGIDQANTRAVGTVEVDGHVLLKDAPVTFLLSLEKLLQESLVKFAQSIPELDSSVEWHWSDDDLVYKTEPVESIRMRKETLPITLAAATENHPEQAQLINKDVPVGKWFTVLESGALSKSDKENLVGKVEAVLEAVKFARARANEVESSRGDVSALMDYLLK